jgi:hypothetical protein
MRTVAFMTFLALSVGITRSAEARPPLAPLHTPLHDHHNNLSAICPVAAGYIANPAGVPIPDLTGVTPWIEAEAKTTTPPDAASLRSCEAKAPPAGCGAELAKLCPRAGAAPVAPAAAPGPGQVTGISWQTAAVTGLAQYLQQRAGDEVVLWLEDTVVQKLCADSYPVTDKWSITGNQLFPTTCGITTTGSSETLGATFAAALREDLQNLPVNLAVTLLSHVPGVNITNAVATVLDADMQKLETGSPPLPLLASLATDPTLKTACAGAPSDVVACSLQAIGILVSWSGDAQTSQTALANGLSAAQSNDDLITVFISAVNGACTAAGAGCPLRLLNPSLDLDRQEVSGFLSSIQTLYALVQSWTQTQGDAATRGGLLIEQILNIVDAGTPLFQAAALANFATAWSVMEPGLEAVAEVMQGQVANGVRDALKCAQAAAKDAGTSLPPPLVTTISLAADLGSATDAAGVQSALQNAAAPLGSWKSKHEHGAITINGYVGGSFGYETPLSGTSNDLKGGTAAGAFAPVGFDFTVPCNGWALGLFVSALDVGQLLTTPVGASSGTSSSTTPSKTAVPGGNVNVVQVLAPGAYLHTSLGYSPIVLGAGVGLAPLLRTYNVDGTGTQVQESMVRANVFLAVDLDLVPIWTAH